MKRISENMLIQFSIASFVMLAALAIVLGWLITNRLERSAKLLDMHDTAMHEIIDDITGEHDGEGHDGETDHSNTSTHDLVDEIAGASVSDIQDEVSSLQRLIVVVIVTGFVLVYASLVSIVWRGWAIIQKQRRQIDEAHQHDMALAITQEKAQMLQNLITDLSHDFKTPLSIIQNNVYLAGKISDTSHQQEKFQRISEQVFHIDRSIESILFLSKLDHTDQTNFEAADLNALVEPLISQFEAKAAERSISLSLIMGSSLPKVFVNVDQINRAIENLLENAIHHSPENGTVILTTLVEDNRPCLKVFDTGGGIDPENLSRIFDPFYRGDPTRPPSRGRTGLGLPIVKRILDLHSGDIRVESTPQKGTLFRLTLPAA